MLMDQIRVDDGHATDAVLTARPEAARTARSMLEPFNERLHDEVVERAKLLVTEVVANSVTHAETAEPIRVRMEARPETLHVQVSDTGPSFDPEIRLPYTGSETGWGLFLVDALSDRWGVRPSDGDVTVWFELDL
jgi:anti-sigma regulatory factor (Ser/Thr protein kinase)